jgi:hypothetical protein
VNQRGAILALSSVVLFGLATPSAKLLIEEAHPFVLAGLLYLGSGIGLGMRANTGNEADDWARNLRTADCTNFLQLCEAGVTDSKCTA